MRRRRWLLLATRSPRLSRVSSATSGSAAGRGAAAGDIVFASDRATANPGEIYALGPGGAVRNVSHSPYADVALATSPTGQGIRLLEQPRGAMAAA